MKKRILALIVAAAMTIGLTACGGDETSSSKASGDASNSSGDAASSDNATGGIPAEDLKIGFIYIGIPGDEGYTYAQNQGRLAVEEKFGVETLIVENVPETSDCAAKIRDLIDQGCNVIFSTSYGFLPYTQEVAEEFPDVYFFHCSGFETSENMASYFGRIYQMRYLSGIVAGLRTETDKIGYVAAMPIAECVRGLDAFSLGVASVNPEATVEVKWTNTWYDPTTEKAAAIELLNSGCDVIAQHQDTTSPQIAAEEAGKWTIGYNSPTPYAAPNGYLTAPIWDWGVYMIPAVQSIVDGTWKNDVYWGDLGTGVVKLDTLTENCAEGTAEAVAAAEAKFAEGFDVFQGPISDNEGTVRIAEGEELTDDEMLNLDWLVSNVIGSVK